MFGTCSLGQETTLSVETPKLLGIINKSNRMNVKNYSINLAYTVQKW